MILEEKELIKEIFDNPEDIKAEEELYLRRLSGLNDEDIEYINDECNQHYYVLNWYLEIFENYFKYKKLSNVDIDILNSNRILGLFSDQRFEIILENDIPQREVLGAIFEEVFNDAILRGKELKLINLDSSIVSTAKNNYTKIILQNKNYTAILINALNSLIEELNYLFEMIFRFKEGASFYTPEEIELLIALKTTQFNFDINNDKKSDSFKTQMLKDFFIYNTNEQLIKDIQFHFKDYEGKSMAVVIYLLQSKFNITRFISKSKTKSLKHFISVLKEIDYSNNDLNNIMSAINKHLHNSSDGALKTYIKSDDAYFLQIHKELNEIIGKYSCLVV